MERTYPPEFIKKAHKATIHHEKDILDSTVCTCFYCGYRFDPHKEEELEWLDENSPKGKTLVCPMCSIDCIIGDASGFPVTDTEFINGCTVAWFGGISRISDGKPIEKANLITIEVS